MWSTEQPLPTDRSQFKPHPRYGPGIIPSDRTKRSFNRSSSWQSRATHPAPSLQDSTAATASIRSVNMDPVSTSRKQLIRPPVMSRRLPIESQSNELLYQTRVELENYKKAIGENRCFLMSCTFPTFNERYILSKTFLYRSI